MPLVSVVVPVYNVEKYLERCVETIKNQTLKDIEIILVDDGSPDNCPALCEDIAKTDSRIKVIHKKNGGLSSARNAGLRVATGKYVGFVDSDDTIDLDMYKKMSDVAENENVDFVMSDYIRILEDNNKFLKTLDIKSGYYSSDDIRKIIFPMLIMKEELEYGPLLSVWHCMYRVDFLKNNGIEFDEEVRWSEDNIFSSFVGYLANSFYYMKGEGLYHYYNNPGTITTGYRKGSFNYYSTMNVHLREFFENKIDYDFERQLKLHIIFYACNSLRQVNKSGENFSGQVKLIKEILNSDQLRKGFKNFKISNSWSFKLKMQIFIMKMRWSLLFKILI